MDLPWTQPRGLGLANQHGAGTDCGAQQGCIFPIVLTSVMALVGCVHFFSIYSRNSWRFIKFQIRLALKWTVGLVWMALRLLIPPVYISNKKSCRSSWWLLAKINWQTHRTKQKNLNCINNCRFQYLKYSIRKPSEISSQKTGTNQLGTKRIL